MQKELNRKQKNELFHVKHLYVHFEKWMAPWQNIEFFSIRVYTRAEFSIDCHIHISLLSHSFLYESQKLTSQVEHVYILRKKTIINVNWINALFIVSSLRKILNFERIKENHVHMKQFGQLHWPNPSVGNVYNNVYIQRNYWKQVWSVFWIQVTDYTIGYMSRWWSSPWLCYDIVFGTII